MPFDSTPSVPAPIATLSDLAHVLRHPELWPPGFEWDFGICRRCAVGLFGALTGGKSVLLITPSDAQVDIFGKGYLNSSTITPEIVAARIEAHLANQPIP